MRVRYASKLRRAFNGHSRLALTVSACLSALVVVGTIDRPAARATITDSGSTSILATGLPDPEAHLVSPKRNARLNGSGMTFQVATTPRKLSELLDLYSSSFGAASRPASDGSSRNAQPGRRLDFGTASQAVELLTQVVNHNFIALDLGDYGFFGGLVPIRETNKQRPLALFRSLSEVVRSGTLDAFDRAVAVAAYRPSFSKQTTFIHIQPRQGFQWKSFLPGSRIDAPGSDPSWFSRPKDSVRLIDFEELDPLAGNSLQIYGVHTLLAQLSKEMESTGMRGQFDSDRRWNWSGSVIPGSSSKASVIALATGHTFATTMVCITDQHASHQNVQ